MIKKWLGRGFLDGEFGDFIGKTFIKEHMLILVKQELKGKEGGTSVQRAFNEESMDSLLNFARAMNLGE